MGIGDWGLGRMGGMTLLPPEFRGAQEGTGRLFPAHDRAPLIVALGQIAVGFDDVLV